MTDNRVHPYIPNTVPSVKQEMLKEIGVEKVDDLYKGIPEELRYRKRLNIPEALTEYELKKTISKSLNNNTSVDEVISFLGGGTWQHFIPAICDEINSRAEFLTAYAGDEYEDHGRFQALFEYQSLVAELVDMDVVNIPTFDWGQAAATSIRMAARKTGRSVALLPKAISPERYQIIRNYCSPDIEVKQIDFNNDSGALDLKQLDAQLDDHVAAIYFENPNYLGFIEANGPEICKLTREAGAVSIVGVDPSSLGVIESPSNYGADIICGELQPLGIHMNFGGGLSGFIATHDDIDYVQEFPSRLFGISPTSIEGEYGFGDVYYDRTSFAKREEGKESVGTQTSMWALTAGVYLASMGPKGMYELGQTIMQNSQYTIEQLNTLKGVKGSRFNTVNFKEFIVDFNETGKTVEEINDQLREKGIFGGINLSNEFPEFGEAALYCVTEIHTKSEIDFLVQSLEEIIS